MARLVALALPLAVLVAPAVASADIQTSGANASLAGGLLDETLPGGVNNLGNQMTLSGSVTPDGIGATTADLTCLAADPTGYLGGTGAFPQTSNSVNPPLGTWNFSVQVPKPGAVSCRMAAVPVPFPNQLAPGGAGFGIYSGSVYTNASRKQMPRSGSPVKAPVGVTLQDSTPNGLVWVSDPAGGGLLGLQPTTSLNGWFWHHHDAWVLGGQIADTRTGRSSVMVDGLKTETATASAARDDTLPGFSPFVLDSYSPLSSSSMTLPFLRFVTVPTPSYVNSGVRLSRRMEIGSGTRVVTMTDTWSSTDGKPHDLDVLYTEGADGGGAAGQSAFRLPWIDGASYVVHAGAIPTLPPGDVSTIYVQRTPGNLLSVPLASPTADVQGSLTVSTRPDSIRFTDGRTFDLGFKRSIPAGGSTTITQVFTAGMSQAEVEAAAATAESSLTFATAAAPTITITSPTSVTSAAYTASGSFTAAAGLSGVTVNGSAATTTLGLTWSAPLTLKPGANVVTAVVKDAKGQSVTAAKTVTYTPPSAKAVFGKPLFRGGLLTLKVGCSGLAGQVCTVGVLLKAKSGSLLKKTLKLKVGKLRTVKLKLPAAGARLLPRSGALASTLTLTQGKAKRTFKLSLRR